MNETILSSVKAAVAGQFVVSETVLDAETNLVEAFGADVLDLTELAMVLEEEFDVVLFGNEAEDSLVTVQDFVTAIQRELGEIHPHATPTEGEA